MAKHICINELEMEKPETFIGHFNEKREHDKTKKITGKTEKSKAWWKSERPNKGDFHNFYFQLW